MIEIWIALALIMGDGIPYPTYLLRTGPSAAFKTRGACLDAVEEWKRDQPDSSENGRIMHHTCYRYTVVNR